LDHINIIEFLIIGAGMRNSISERFDLLQRLGGLPEPEVINEEWLYILKEETRNSILIEGFFLSEEELEEVLASGNPVRRNQKEALNYYTAARFLYGLSYENYRSKKFFFGIPLVRQTSKTIGEKGEFRKGDLRITGAKIVPPPGLYVDDWMAFFEEHVNQGFSREGFLNFLAKQHVLFEAIHPFNDGNGRTGRIILNYFLISAGYPPVILKGDEENKKKYYKALEQGDSVLRTLTEIPFSRQDVRNVLEDMNAFLLEDLISESLRGSFDRILIRLLEEKEHIKLKPAQVVGKALNYSPDSIRTLISRGKFIAVKRGKEWFTHEKLLVKKNGAK
jgi:Fic family protein